MQNGPKTFGIIRLINVKKFCFDAFKNNSDDIFLDLPYEFSSFCLIEEAKINFPLKFVLAIELISCSVKNKFFSRISFLFTDGHALGN